MMKQRYPSMPRKRRFLALTASAGVNASGRALERAQRENEAQRERLASIINLAEYHVESVYDNDDLIRESYLKIIRLARGEPEPAKEPVTVVRKKSKYLDPNVCHCGNPDFSQDFSCANCGGFLF